MSCFGSLVQPRYSRCPAAVASLPRPVIRVTERIRQPLQVAVRRDREGDVERVTGRVTGLNRLNNKDLLSGAIYTALGLAVVMMSTGYRMGRAAEMGPGYFPFLVGSLLAATGLAILGKAALSARTENMRITNFDLKSLCIITVSVIAFGLCVSYLGLICAVVALVVISSTASHAFTWKAALLNATLLSVFSVVLFVEGLGVQIPILPPFLQN